MQDKSLFFHIDTGFGIDCQREIERFYEGRLDLPDQAETCPELAVDRGPTDRGGLAEGVQPVG
jgi:hypothetical protein